MKRRQVIYGIATFMPGIHRLWAGHTGGTDSARYCYSVWLRHLVMAKRNGLNPYPKVVAELGPGDSLGVGLAALISGCDKYVACDVVAYANAERNVRIFDALVTLFRNRENIPGNEEFPRVRPHLPTYAFPADVLNESRLEYALAGSRLQRIRDSIDACTHEDAPIQYAAPWYDVGVVDKEFADMVYSQSVLQQVDDLRTVYAAMHAWLKPTGFVSHEIDFKCHGTAEEWNGHWAYSDLTWRLIRGGRPYLLNREPHSTHMTILKEEGYQVVCDLTVKSASRLTPSEVAPRFRSMSRDDLTISSAFIQAVKRNHRPANDQRV